jgi:hypothetical protein
MKNPLEFSTADLNSIREKLLKRHHELLTSDIWQSFPEEMGIKSWIHHPADKKISILRAESIINCSAQKLFDFLVTDIDKTCSQWNDVMYYSGSIKNYGDGFELSRIISEGHAVADREDVFLRCTGKLPNGAIYEVSEGYNAAQVPIDKSHTKYIVRSEMYFASKEFVAINENQCIYKTIWHYDPMGWLTKMIPRKTFGKLILKNLVHEHKKLKGIFKS